MVGLWTYDEGIIRSHTVWVWLDIAYSAIFSKGYTKRRGAKLCYPKLLNLECQEPYECFHEK